MRVLAGSTLLAWPAELKLNVPGVFDVARCTAFTPAFNAKLPVPLGAVTVTWVCIGGLTSATVGAVLRHDVCAEITVEVFKEVWMTVPEGALCPLSTQPGPLLTAVPADAVLETDDGAGAALEKGPALAEPWEFTTTTLLPFRVVTVDVPRCPLPSMWFAVDVAKVAPSPGLRCPGVPAPASIPLGCTLASLMPPASSRAPGDAPQTDNNSQWFHLYRTS